MKGVIGGLSDPMLYMEFRGVDSRLAVSKLRGFLMTYGYAQYSKNKFKEEMKGGKGTRPRMHMRYAVLDFNNCFDLLLQIPWVYYRMWENFNPKGDIQRGEDGWLDKVEGRCSWKRLSAGIKKLEDANMLRFLENLENFSANYLENVDKPFTIRQLANAIKHRGFIDLSEYQVGYGAKIETDKDTIPNYDKNDGYLRLDIDLHENGDMSTPTGKCTVWNMDNVRVEYEYDGDCVFPSSDLVGSKVYNSENIYIELCRFDKEIIKLFNEVRGIIEPKLELLSLS
ncbi:hypothetical protein [Bacillus sp. NEAU-Y102]